MQVNAMTGQHVCFGGLVFDVCVFRVNGLRVNHIDCDMTGQPSESSLSSSCA